MIYLEIHKTYGTVQNSRNDMILKLTALLLTIYQISWLTRVHRKALNRVAGGAPTPHAAPHRAVHLMMNSEF